MVFDRARSVSMPHVPQAGPKLIGNGCLESSQLSSPESRFYSVPPFSTFAFTLASSLVPGSLERRVWYPSHAHAPSLQEALVLEYLPCVNPWYTSGYFLYCSSIVVPVVDSHRLALLMETHFY